MRGTYNTNSHITVKTTMLKSSLCDYSDVYILLKETIIVPDTSSSTVVKIIKFYWKTVLYLLIA